MTIDLIAAAQAAHATYLADQAKEKADTATAEEESQADFLREAAAHAVELLGTTAEGLPWINTPELAPHTYAATAALAPLRAHNVHLNLRFDAYNGEYSLALVRTCRSCTEQLTDQVKSLTDLGRLLDDGQPEDTEDQEPGPLAALRSVEDRAARVARFVHRLTAEHPTAGLTITHTALFGHDNGSGSATLRVQAMDAAAACQVAEALGLEVSVATREDTGPYGSVYERVAARGARHGIDIDLTGITTLTDDQITTWRAQENQGQDQVADGGDV